MCMLKHYIRWLYQSDIREYISSSHYLYIQIYFISLDTRGKRSKIPRALIHPGARGMFVYSFSAHRISFYISPVYFRSSYGGISIVITP